MFNSKCNFCGSEDFDERRVQYVYQRNGKYLIVRDVPCEVCLRCGERFYPAEAMLAIEQRFKSIHDKHEPPLQTVEIPIEPFVAA